MSGNALQNAFKGTSYGMAMSGRLRPVPPGGIDSVHWTDGHITQIGTVIQTTYSHSRGWFVSLQLRVVQRIIIIIIMHIGKLIPMQRTDNKLVNLVQCGAYRPSTTIYLLT